MAVDVIMPQMGESIFEGTITKWLKKPGDAVKRDEPLFEISTDKVDAEIPSPAAGVLAEIKARGASENWATIRARAWAAVVGLDVEPGEPPSAPYTAMLRRDWLGAADAFGVVGWTYDRVDDGKVADLHANEVFIGFRIRIGGRHRIHGRPCRGGPCIRRYAAG